MPNKKNLKLIGYRPTWAEINLDHLAYNILQIKRKLPPKTKVMPCVKADAYGHGLVPVARKLVSCNVDYLSVASIDEAIQLRKANIDLPILVLGMILKKDIAPLFKYNITQTVCTEELAIALNNMAKAQRRNINIHIKIDTGMGRIGVLHHEALKFIKKTHKLKHVNIEGIFTHLACADVNRSFTLYQIDIFERLISELQSLGIQIPLIHVANSIGIISYKESHFNMVRPGLVMYGLYPQEGLDIKLKPVLSLKARVVYVKKVPRGWGISYGHTYITERDSTIVTLPIGYGDGYPRSLSNIAPVIIKGKLLKVSGRVCMDQAMVDVGKLSVKVGDEVTLIGAQGRVRITTEELAQLSGTIPYEIVCGIGSRVSRMYITGWKKWRKPTI